MLEHLFEEPVELQYTPKGAPVLPIHLFYNISISHSDHLLAIALTPIGVPVGIDIEEKADQAMRLLDRYSSRSEQQQIREVGLSPIALWSAKEALYKAYSDRTSGFGEQIRFVSSRDETRFTFEISDDEGNHTYREVKIFQNNILSQLFPLDKYEIEQLCLAYTMEFDQYEQTSIYFI